MSDQVADVLDDAADLLEREGWIQGALHGAVGHCADGALEIASCRYNASANTDMWLAATDALGECIGFEHSTIPGWNDNPARTKQQVLDTFRAAAKQERMRPETPAPPRIPERDGAGTELAGGDAETRTRPADESHPPPSRSRRPGNRLTDRVQPPGK
jgi:hypothetical protein